MGVGFGKSRGLGFVTVDYLKATVQYPLCQVKGEKVVLLGNKRSFDNHRIYAAGEFLDDPTRKSYGFPANDIVPSSNNSEIPITAQAMPLGIGTQMIWEGQSQIHMLFEQTVDA